MVLACTVGDRAKIAKGICVSNMPSGGNRPHVRRRFKSRLEDCKAKEDSHGNITGAKCRQKDRTTTISMKIAEPNNYGTLNY